MAITHRLLAGLQALSLTALSGATALVPLLTAPVARAEATSGFEFRWETNKDYRKLYYALSSGSAATPADWYLLLGPKDRKTALIKLVVSLPKEFDSQVDPKQVDLCIMEKGGVRGRTGCKEVIPAAIEVAGDSSAIEVFPERPIPVGKTIGLHLRLTNPYNPGMYQLNALGQMPGDVPVSGYLGSWVVEIGPNY